MGARVGAVCYPSQADALDAFYSELAPVQVVSATSLIGVYVWNGSSWRYKKFSVSSVGAWTTSYDSAAPVLSFPSCTVLNDASTNFADGMTLGWGVAAAMVAAWGIMFLAGRLK